jgi:ribosomal protein L11 methylase PrmA
VSPDAGRDYAIRRCVAPAELSEVIVEELTAVGFTGFAIASRADGRIDLELYALGAIPAAVAAALARLGVAAVADVLRGEHELLAGLGQDEPFAVAEGVWIDPLGGFSPPAGSLVLRIPPSAAFGDGRHPSTRIAAGLLLRVPMHGRRVLDLGCGTGVLGILAARLGAGAVAFADIDADAVRAARDCCALNHLDGAEVRQANLLEGAPDGAFDVLLGNLYADLLLRLAEDPRLDRTLPRGELIVSGIAHQRLDAVRAAFVARGFRVVEQADGEWWRGMRLTR